MAWGHAPVPCEGKDDRSGSPSNKEGSQASRPYLHWVPRYEPGGDYLLSEQLKEATGAVAGRCAVLGAKNVFMTPSAGFPEPPILPGSA